jgi:hypothetical protein
VNDLTVEIDGTTYQIEAKEPNHGFHHWHDDPHPDGTPGQPGHHHHDEKCTWLPAMLKPVAAPAGRDDHIASVEDDDVRVTMKLYPEEVEMLYDLVADQVSEDGDDWDVLLTAVAGAHRRVVARRQKLAERQNR